MAMDERDRIDIIATLHDRFNKPADDIIRKMERMENQADETGDSIDELEDSLDKESRTTRENTKHTEENTKGRRRHKDAIDEQGQSLARSTRHLNANTDAVRDSLAPGRRATQAHRDAARAAGDLADETVALNEAQSASNDGLRESRRVLNARTRAVNQARDAMGRFVKVTDSANETLRNNTRYTQENTKSQEENTRQKEHDRREWTKWDTKIRKITEGFGKRFRPIGAFFQNYFKILGAFRAILFSDIGAALPQLITAIVALGAAFNALLAPTGRLLANLAQIVPFLAAFVQTQTVVKMAIGGVSEALKVLNDETATLEDLNKAQKELGTNTWNMAKAVKQLGEDFKPLQRQVRETFLEGMVPAISGLVDTYFPLLRRELTNTAKIMNGELRQGMKALQTDEKQQTIANVMERSSVASGLFVDILWSLLDVFIELADAAGPAFLETLEAIDGRLDQFSDWVRDNKDELTDFFNRANDTAGNFFRGLGFIALGLYGIAKAAEPLTDFLYGGDRLESWAERMNNPEAQEQMRKGYEDMIPNLEALGNLMRSIIDGAKEIATSEWFAPLINDLADNGIPMIVEYFKELDETVGPPLLRISEALDDIDPDVLTSVLAPLGDALGGLAWALETIVPLFNALPKPMQEVVTYGIGLSAMGLPGLFGLMLGGLKPLVGMFNAGKWAIGRFAGAIVDIVESPFGKKIGEMAKAVGRFLAPIGDFLKKHLGKLGGGGLIAKIFGKVAGKGILAVAGPVGVVIGVLWLLWDVLSWLWNNVKPFRDFMTGVWDWIVEAWNVSIDWIVNTAVPWIVDAFNDIWEGIKQVGQWIADFYNTWIKPVVDAIIEIGKLIFVFIGTVLILPWKLLWNILEPIVGWIINAFQVAIPLVLDILKQKWEQVTSALGLAWQYLKDGFMLIVGGIAYGAIWLWTQMKNVAGWIVNVWNTAWAWVGQTVANVWNWIKNSIINPVVAWFMTYVWPTINSVIHWIVGAFVRLRVGVAYAWAWIKNMIINPFVNWFMNVIWPKISTAIGWLVNKFNWLRDRVGNAWDWIKDKLNRVYDNSISPMFNRLKAGVDAVKSAFNTARDAIGKAWDDIKNRAKEPIGFVIDKVYNEGIMPVWNGLADVVDLKGKRLSEVKWAKDAYDTGGYTGAGSKYQPAGVVHADEFVIKKTSQRSLRREAPGFLDALNKYGARALSGMGAGYAGGGKVLNSWQSIARIPHEGMRVTSTVRSGARTAGTGSVSKHAQGLAVDFAGAAGAMRSFFNFVRNNYSVSELIHTPMGGRQLSRGGIPRANFPSATARGHYDHVHVGGWGPGEKKGAGAFAGASASGSASSDSWFPNPFEGMLDRLLGKLPGSGGFKDLAVNATTSMINNAKNWIASKLNVFDGLLDSGGSAGGSSGGAERWRATAKSALMHTGDYSEGNLSALLRRMNQESGGNPSAINNWDSNAKKGIPSKGLMQVIDPTFRSYRDASLSGNIYDPMANIVASIRYAKSRYGNLASAYNRRGGYFTGGLVDHLRFMGGPVETWGNTLVGEFGPEIFMPSDGGPASLLGLTGPEVLSFDREGSILPHEAVAALSTVSPAPAQGGDTHTGDVINIGDITVNGNGSPQDVKAAVAEALREHDRKRKERR